MAIEAGGYPSDSGADLKLTFRESPGRTLEIPGGLGNEIVLSGRISGAECHLRTAVALFVDFDGSVPAETIKGTGLNWSKTGRPYLYISSASEGGGEFTKGFSIPPGHTLRGLELRLWGSNQQVDFTGLRITRAFKGEQSLMEASASTTKETNAAASMVVPSRSDVQPSPLPQINAPANASPEIESIVPQSPFKSIMAWFAKLFSD